jgi:hypothetical protein
MRFTVRLCVVLASLGAVLDVLRRRVMCCVGPRRERSFCVFTLFE